MQNSFVDTIINEVKDLKFDFEKNPIKVRVRKHIFDVNDVITDEDIRNIKIGFVNANDEVIRPAIL